ncbi:helix-turn-helix domain-containing protein [Anaerobacillus sp. MEB173]|uniref:helix-turn-helix domain-containing protein n=1 Tax=Anaerobacillus sp. MEB173 TaxID=3383345 RepID=UPI003F9289DE
MVMSKTDLILHPVRMKIIQSLIKRPLTVQELLEWLPEIPQATLYRQLKILTDNSVIYISSERKVRGAMERTYSLNQEAANLSAEEANQISKDEHMKYFMTYFANIMEIVEEYLDCEGREMAKDGFGYRQSDLYLDDEEFQQFKIDLTNIMKKYAANEPAKQRRRRTFATIVVPKLK